jgi:hypothetical protein
MSMKPALRFERVSLVLISINISISPGHCYGISKYQNAGEMKRRIGYCNGAAASGGGPTSGVV